MRLRTLSVTVLVSVLLGTFTVQAGASYPLGESDVTPTPGSRVDLGPKLVKDMLVSFSTPRAPRLLVTTVEIATENVLDPDGTLANDRSAGSGFLFARSGGTGFVGKAFWTNAIPGTYYFQFSGTKVSALVGPDDKCPGGEATCVLASRVYTIKIPVPARVRSGWIDPRHGRARRTSGHLSATQARAVARRAIRRQAGRNTRDLELHCDRRGRGTFACNTSWSDRRHVWAVTITAKAASRGYTYSGRGQRASRSCLQRASMDSCARKVRWPVRRLAYATDSTAGRARV